MVRPGLQGFHAADYALFAITIAVSLGIGIIAACTGGKQKTMNEYLMGNRQMSVLPVSISIFMSFISSVLVIGNTAEMYSWGIQLWLQSIGGTIACVLCAIMFVPLFHPLKLTSAFEYLEMRFQSKAVPRVAVVFLIIQHIIMMGLVTFAPATALEGVTGFPTWASIICCIVVATIYTAIGGLKAVIWTDVFQGCVFLVGIIVVIAVGTQRVGGITEVWDIAYKGGRLDILNINPDPAQRLNFWAILFGSTLHILAAMSLGQTSVQRFCALPSVNKARLSMLLDGPFFVLIITLTSLVGLVVYSYYASIGCDPLKAKYIANPNQLLPYFIMDVVNIPGVPGCFLAILFSGSLSTVSSSLSALSTVVWRDLLKWKFDYLPESKKTLITKLLALLFGILGGAMSFAVRGLGGHILKAAKSLIGGTAGPLLGMFMLGAIFPRANHWGTIIASICGVTFTLSMAIGDYVYKPYRVSLPTNISGCTNLTLTPVPPRTDPEGVPWIFRITFIMYTAIGCITTVIIGLLLSICKPMNRKHIDPKLIIPMCDWFCCCLPERLRHKMWCCGPIGEEYKQKEKICSTTDYNEKQNGFGDYHNLSNGKDHQLKNGIDSQENICTVGDDKINDETHWSKF